MGYQESYIFTKKNEDLDKIISMFDKHEIRTTGDNYCSCACKITLNKDIEDEFNTKYKKGKQFLYMVGERHEQRCIGNMFNINEIDYTDQEKKLINKVDIVFTEYFPSSKIFNDSEYASIEDIVL